MAFCPKCGAAQNEGMIFCANCGARLEQPVATGQQPNNQPNQPPFVPPYQMPYQPQYIFVKPKVPGKGLGIASMVLGIIGLVYSFTALMAGMDYIDSSHQSSTNLIGNLVLVIMLASMSIMGVAFSTSAKNKGYKTGISTAGLVTGTIGLIIYVVSAVLFCVA